ncbi:MAG: NAD(P)-dependent oxidoreductase [Gammaproteobacteria bacterium]
MTTASIGFIGLGAMGSEMVRHLLGAGHQVTVWARRADALAPHVAAGATVAASPAALARACDHVFLCVTDTAAVEDVVFGSDGIAAAAPHAGVLVDHSTIHPLATRELAARLRASTGMAWVDAPVSGGVPGARGGALVVMAGGAADDLARVEHLIGHYAQRITHLGAVGSGQAAKVVNQVLIGGAVAVVAEAFSYAAAFGVDAARLPDALAGGWADSTVLQNHARRMAAADYAGDVDARIMAKDMDIALDMGRATGVPMPVSALVQQLYRRLVAEGQADKGQIGLMWLYHQGPL